MKLAFSLYRYFPFGGLQRDFIRIARACLRRGHEIDVYTAAWEGEEEKGLEIKILPSSGWQNHKRLRSFAQQFNQQLRHKNYDLIVGFNKMPGLDIYYAADVCYQSRIKIQKPFWYRCLPRYKSYLQDESQVFSPYSHTKILLLSEIQGNEYRAYYQLPAEHFYLLPPGISQDRKAPPEAELIREELRQSYQVTAQDEVLLMVGSGFKTKGLDRVLKGMAALPPHLKSKLRLWVVGQDKAEPFLKQARQLGLSSQVHFLGGRHDVQRFFLAADFLVHPAYHENTGTVLLEAMAAGLPVLTVDICGYAHYVRDAQAGLVLSSPFEQKQFNQTLQSMLLSPYRTEWKKNGLAFAQTAEIYSLPEKAADFIESLAAESQKKALVYPPQNFLNLHSKTAQFTCLSPPHKSGEKEQFQHYMRLSGECFREQKGRRTQRIFIDNKPYFIKQHFGVGWKEIFKNLIQFKLPILSAKNEWQAIEALQKLSILTPSIKAYGCRGLNPAGLHSFLLMEELSGTMSLEEFCSRWKKEPPSFLLKKALIHKVAEIAKTMHEHGINHRDFYLCHFLLELNSLGNKKNSQAPKIYLIDLHRAGLYKKLRARWIIKDVAGLYFSSKDLGLTQRDYLRFIKAYRQEPLRDIIIKELHFWQKVAKRGEKLYHAHASSQ